MTSSGSDVPCSLAATLGVLGRYVPAALVQPERLRLIQPYLRGVTSGASVFYGFECRLAGNDPKVDFLFCSTIEAGGCDALADDQGLAADLEQHPVWQRIRRFCKVWRRPDGPLRDKVTNTWLELDIDGPRALVPVPSFFCGLYAVYPELRRDAEGPGREAPPIDDRTSPGRQPDWLLDGAVPLVRQEPLARRTRHAAAHCFERLPERAMVFQAGVMLSRPDDFIRLCVWNVPLPGILPYLDAIGWAADRELRARLEALIGTLGQIVDGAHIDIDVTDGVAPKIGLECYVHAAGEKGMRWKPLFDYLRREGLCAEEKARAMAQWRGVRWVHAAELGPRAESLFGLSLNHVKLTVAPGQPLQAKAYLAVKQVPIPQRVLDAFPSGVTNRPS